MRLLSAFGAAVLLVALGSGPAWGQSAANVLLVVNEASPESIEIGAYYAKARQIPADRIVRLSAPVSDSVSRPVFDASVHAPIWAFIARRLLHDEIHYIVLTKGVPLRVEGTGGVNGTVASVDSELTLLYRRMLGIAVPVVGRLDNPLYLGEKPISDAKPFSRRNSDVYLVTRLDGFTVADVKALIDRGLKPEQKGQIVLDQRGPVVERGGDEWLQEASDRLTTIPNGPPVQLESTRAVAKVDGPVLGYFSWGSNDPGNQLRVMGLQFANGAIGAMFVSTGARTFREPNPNWRPAPSGFGTGGESLIGDLIREGITGVVGQVAEPYLDAIVRPQILFPVYLNGFNLAESFYLSMPFLGWQDIVVGDPLCAPFRGADTRQPPSTGIDPSTSLPSLFSERRLNLIKIAAPSANMDAAALDLQGWSLLAQGKPEAEVDAVLDRATAIDPGLVAPQLRLAAAAERRKDYDGAIGRYRAVLAAEPDNLLALNNLAYALADRKNAAAEALPLALRAYRLSNQAPAIADTLGWVHFKLGDTALALPLLERAAKAEPGNVDILIHAATAHASMGNSVQARRYVDAAIKVDPKAADRSDVKALIGKLVI